MTGQCSVVVDAGRLVAHSHSGAGMLSVHLGHFVIVVAAFVAFMGCVWREDRNDKSGEGSRSDNPTSPAHWLIVSLMVLAGVSHIPVTAEHLREAPYMGVLFIAFTVASLGIAGLLTFRSSVRAYALAAGLCASAVGAYVATRLVAFPQQADDVGAWLEPLGVLCVVSEAVVVAAAGWKFAADPNGCAYSIGPIGIVAR